MAPEQEAQERAFYDHESEQPRRRRRAAADWGVNEDIFDRMPSRFSRIERRAEHHEIVIRSEGETATATIDHDVARRETGDRTQVELVREEPRRRESGMFARIDAGERGDTRRGDVARRESGTFTRPEADERSEPRRPAAGARAEVRRPNAGARGARGETELDPRAAARAVMSWGEDLDDAPLVPGESRTIVLSRDEDDREREPVAGDDPVGRRTGEPANLPAEPRERRTVKISGHPDRLPVPRTERRPRTAVERIGHRPDRVAAYAVALGFLLVLIAVLTTGQ